MTPTELIAQANQKGLVLALDGENIRVQGVRMCDFETKVLIEMIRRQKEQVVAALKAPKDDQSPEQAIELADGRIIAVEIFSTVLEAEIWFALTDDWHLDAVDNRAVFYASELEFLKTKTSEQLREIHRVKLAFGSRSIVQQ